MSDILQKADDFILNLFKEKLPNTFTYHNYTHSKRVYKSINEIIENSEINVKDTTILQLSALLHDTGYIKTRDGHEEESVKIAEAFLKEEKVAQDIIDGVSQCIMATKFKGDPEGRLEEMIRDADASHFAKKYFQEASDFLRQEYKLQGVKEYTSAEWRVENIKVLSKKQQF
jgi:HD superfamily phosphodiesterase